MKAPFVLAPDAARDLVEIWRYISRRASRRIADRVEMAIISKLEAIAAHPGLGHRRDDLFTDESLRFIAVYSYLIVYRPESIPVEVAAIVHAHRDIDAILRTRG